MEDRRQVHAAVAFEDEQRVVCVALEQRRRHVLLAGEGLAHGGEELGARRDRRVGVLDDLVGVGRRGRALDAALLVRGQLAPALARRERTVAAVIGGRFLCRVPVGHLLGGDLAGQQGLEPRSC
jgi:hypothetical protein